MSGKPTREVQLAVAWALRTRCSTADAAKRYGCSVHSVRRGLAAAGAARPVGRPAKTEQPS